MKKIIFLIPLLIICQVAYADVAIQNDQKYIDNDGLMHIIGEIENNSNIQLNNGNWSLHWNQLGGAIINSSLPNGIVSKRVNGEYYIMNLDVIDYGSFNFKEELLKSLEINHLKIIFV